MLGVRAGRARARGDREADRARPCLGTVGGFGGDVGAADAQPLAESERRVKAVDAAIGKKNWESVRRDLDGQVYNMRNTMNYLAAGPSAQPGAKAAAKQFYQDMEAVNLLCKRKKQAAAQDAYGAMMSSLDSFNKLI